jgi:hypothetical protein
VTKAAADFRPPVELPSHAPGTALLFDDARELQIRPAEALPLTVEERTPSETCQ